MSKGGRHQLSPEQIAAIGPVDLLLLPVGGTYTVDGDGASQVAAALKPKLVIPMHFKTAKCNFPISGPEPFLSRMKVVKNLGKSEIELTSGTLPGGTEVWVLDHAR
jgi:L-ascorbate metabolism protein UlaG (beta-lactamase superfamily)